MTLSDFQECVDRLGTDLSRWAPEVAISARVLLGQSARARQLLREGDEFNALFRATTPVKAPSGLVDRIMSRAMADGQPDTVIEGNQTPCPNTSENNVQAPDASAVSDIFPQKHTAHS